MEPQILAVICESNMLGLGDIKGASKAALILRSIVELVFRFVKEITLYQRG